MKSCVMRWVFNKIMWYNELRESEKITHTVNKGCLSKKSVYSLNVWNLINCVLEATLKLFFPTTNNSQNFIASVNGNMDLQGNTHDSVILKIV